MITAANGSSATQKPPAEHPVLDHADVDAEEEPARSRRAALPCSRSAKAAAATNTGSRREPIQVQEAPKVALVAPPSQSRGPARPACRAPWPREVPTAATRSRHSASRDTRPSPARSARSPAGDPARGAAPRPTPRTATRTRRRAPSIRSRIDRRPEQYRRPAARPGLMSGPGISENPKAVTSSANIAVSSEEQLQTASGPASARNPSPATRPAGVTPLRRSARAVTTTVAAPAQKLTALPATSGNRGDCRKPPPIASSTLDQSTCRKSE